MSRAGVWLLLTTAACSYILPATWRAFRADPDDAAPAITRALDSRQISVESFDQAGRKITTGWEDTNDGVDRIRQRYIISWERDDMDKTLTIYVRHEVQDQEIDDGRPAWGATYHDSEKESRLLDSITKELKALAKSDS
jgi:hypothetical protein